MVETWRQELNTAYWFAPLTFSVSLPVIHHQPKCSTAHTELGLPTSNVNQVNTPEVCPQANLTGAFSQLQFPVLK